MFLLLPGGSRTYHRETTIEILLACTCDVDKNVDMSNDFGILYPYFWNPLRTILISFEAFMTMSIATERFMAVNKPVHFKMSRMSRSSRAHFCVFILPVILSAFVINAPKFFEFEFEESINSSLSIKASVKLTDLRLDPNYVFWYTHVIRLIFSGILPIIYLTAINTLIFRKIKEAKQVRYWGGLRRFGAAFSVPSFRCRLFGAAFSVPRQFGAKPFRCRLFGAVYSVPIFRCQQFRCERVRCQSLTALSIPT